MMEIGENEKEIEIEKRRVRYLGIPYTMERPVFKSLPRGLARVIQLLIVVGYMGCTVFAAIGAVVLLAGMFNHFTFLRFMGFVGFVLVAWISVSVGTAMRVEFDWNFNIGKVPSLDEEVIK